MKKTVLVTCAAACIISLCLAAKALAQYGASSNAAPDLTSDSVPAQTQAPNATNAPANPVPAAAAETTFIGKVEFILIKDLVNGPNPQITVKDDNGLRQIFTVASGASIFDKEGNSTTLNWIKKDDKVAVVYETTQDGSNIAKSIKVSSGW